MNVQKTIEHTKEYIKNSGYFFEDGMEENFYLCLKSNPMTVLYGPDGCGKYTFARTFCDAIGANIKNSRFTVISVGADDYGKGDFLGCESKDGDAAEFILNAAKDKDNPYFMYIDNMNLSNPDSYLSGLYTAIDTRETPLLSRHAEVFYPENLYIIGGFDSDADCHCLSPKIKNRANVIPMNILNSRYSKAKKCPEPVLVKNEFLRQKYFSVSEVDDDILTKEVFSYTDEINKALSCINREISYRCRNEILYYLKLNREFNLIGENEALDNIILQKILPRVEGNSAYIKTILSMLFKLCVPKGVGDYASGSLKMLRALTYPDCRYPKSAKQIALMAKTYEENGYITY